MIKCKKLKLYKEFKQFLLDILISLLIFYHFLLNFFKLFSPFYQNIIKFQQLRQCSFNTYSFNKTIYNTIQKIINFFLLFSDFETITQIF